jgi:hypothetical protein
LPTVGAINCKLDFNPSALEVAAGPGRRRSKLEKVPGV